MKYLGPKIREKIVSLIVSMAIIDEFKEDEARYRDLFGRAGWSWLKQANSLILKAIQEGLNPNIDDTERKKIHDYTTKYRPVLLRRSEPLPLEFLSVRADHVYDLAEQAMGVKCDGCTIVKHKECPLYQALRNMQVPAANEEKGRCPYVV